MLSQFFILSPRGDALVTKDFRRDLPRRTHETFYRTVRAWARSRRREDGEEDAEESAMGEHSGNIAARRRFFARMG